MLNITATTGKAIAHVKVDDKQRMGECFMPIHWSKYFASHANVSALYQSIVDPISGQVEAKQGAVALSKKNFKHYLNIHTNNEFNISADFWLKNISDYGTAYQAAFDEHIPDNLLWCQKTTKLLGEWLTFEQGNQSFIVCLQSGKLVALAYFASQWPVLETNWLNHVFSQQRLDFATIQSLLLGIANDEFTQGKQVCSCFNIGEKTIIKTISQGCSSVEKLGKTLQCGTQCGSCKPELASLIRQHKSVESLILIES
jgi:assimilatory nitrate reductase catalytic subunit